MNTDALFNVFAFQRWYLDRLLNGIDEADLARQPGQIVNHPAWQLGHLAHVADQVIGILGGAPSLGEAWAKRFARGTTPVGDRAAYPSRAELIATLDDRRDALVARCKTLGDAEWNRPNPIDGMNAVVPTVWGAAHVLMLSHEGTHHGQLAAWRHARGMPQALANA